MARSTDEIQADIALTRQLIERELDVIAQRLPRRRWMPYAGIAAAFMTGALLARVPLLSLIKVGARTLETGLAVASAFAAVDRFVAARRGTAAARRRAA
jgi:hypothetical protein